MSRRRRRPTTRSERLRRPAVLLAVTAAGLAARRRRRGRHQRARDLPKGRSPTRCPPHARRHRGPSALARRGSRRLHGRRRRRLPGLGPAGRRRARAAAAAGPGAAWGSPRTTASASRRTAAGPGHPEPPDDGGAGERRSAEAHPRDRAGAGRAEAGLRRAGEPEGLRLARLAAHHAALEGLPRATDYNVQIFRGQRRVLNAWSKDTRLRVPLGVLKQGRTYVWWSGRPTARAARRASRCPSAARPSPSPCARGSSSARWAAAPQRGGAAPHPLGTLRLRRPDALRGRVPSVVTINRRGRFDLPISKRAAERIGAVLTDRGPEPPVGLRGPGRR